MKSKYIWNINTLAVVNSEITYTDNFKISDVDVKEAGTSHKNETNFNISFRNNTAKYIENFQMSSRDLRDAELSKEAFP